MLIKSNVYPNNYTRSRCAFKGKYIFSEKEEIGGITRGEDVVLGGNNFNEEAFLNYNSN